MNSDWTHTELGIPRPRARELPYTDARFSITRRRYLEIPKELPAANLWEVIERRRSRRALGPLSEELLSAFLWHTAKTRSTGVERSGFLWQHRPAPSAGGRHPIDILVISRPHEPETAVYDPRGHALCDLTVANSLALQNGIKEICEVTMSREGAILLFVASFGRTLSKYEHGESLVWRDSGALLGQSYIVSAGLGLGCCGIGLTGEPWVSDLLGNPSGVRGVGGCVVGKP